MTFYHFFNGVQDLLSNELFAMVIGFSTLPTMCLRIVLIIL